MGNDNVWQRLLAAIQNRIHRQNFDIWFSQIQFIEELGDEIHLQVPSRYFHDWIRDNYLELIQAELEKLEHRTYKLVFHYTTQPTGRERLPEAEQELKEELEKPAEAVEESSFGQFSLNQDQTFESFVVGSSNQFAHAAARAVADKPAQTYNPLFIFGTVGLGKTHLLNAIGNQIVKNRPGARVIYLSSEQFVNELINSIRHERMQEFRNRYRDNCDALLVDDIQFLAGKIRTQEEFFYTFNALHSSGRQIVVTSDKFPREIQGMEERLRNRFEWGLIADIQPPDLETKVAILKKKAFTEKAELPDDVAHFIAKHSKNNIRELEGNLTRLIATSTFYRKPIDLAFAQHALRTVMHEERPPVNCEAIIEATAQHFSIKVGDLKSHRKHKQLVQPRQVAMYLCRKHTTSSFPEIGQKFGGRDHTTVIHAVKKIEDALSRDIKTREDVENVERLSGL